MTPQYIQWTVCSFKENSIGPKWGDTFGRYYAVSACFYFSVVKQVNPTQIIVSSKQDERLMKTLKTYGKLRKLLITDTIGCFHAAK